MGTDTSDPIGGHRPPAPPAKKKTISGPYQSYQVVVSVSTLTELQTMQPPGVDGAPTFFRDNGLPWFWFRNLPAGYTASSDGHTGATASTKAGFYVSLFALTAAAALGAFLTVARASSSRMLDVPASTLYLVKDGARTYVQSFVSGWHWEANFPAATATDNETTCRPIAWATLGLNGAFVRDLQGDRTTWTQSAWVVNSTAADNEGNGSALDPLKTDAEIQRRLGPAPQLAQPTTITWSQSPAGVTNLDVTVLNGASVSFLGVATSTAPVVISAVTVQNRATPQAWDITAPNLGAAHVGFTIEISQSATPANVGAYAEVLKDLGGGRVRVSPFGTKAVSTGTHFVNVTPAVGDSVIVHTVPILKVGTLAVRSGFQATAVVASPPQNCAIVDLLSLQGGPAGLSNGGGEILNIGVPMFFQRVWLDSLRLGGQVFGGGRYYFSGLGTKGGFSAIQGTQQVQASSCGFLASLQYGQAVSSFLNQDCYFQATALTAAQSVLVQSNGCGFFDRAFATITAAPGGVIQQLGAVPDWGASAANYGITVQSAGAYTYATKPTLNSGLGPGRETIVGGTDKLLAALPYVEVTNTAALVATA